jgi:hypothetical protein
MDMYERSLKMFLEESKVEKDNALVIFEITLSNLRSEGDSFKIKMIEETFFKKMFNETEL